MIHLGEILFSGILENTHRAGRLCRMLALHEAQARGLVCSSVACNLRGYRGQVGESMGQAHRPILPSKVKRLTHDFS